MLALGNYRLDKSIILRRYYGNYAVGIDLGTTNSCVAVYDNGKVDVIENSEGMRTTPSVVAINKDNSYVGTSAKANISNNYKNTIFAAKRLVGRKFADIKKDIDKLPYKVVEGTNGDAWIDINGKLYSPSQISGMILEKMKETAEQHLGTKIQDVVVTVPAYFDDSQRQATKHACRIAGLNAIRIINEPTAAALAYGINKDTGATKRIAVYDLGGGTFDISILELSNGIFEVLATNGNTALGGEDIDKAIQEYLGNICKQQYGIDIYEDKLLLQRFRESAETAKKELSKKTMTEVNLPFIGMKDGKPISFQHILTQDTFRKLAYNILQQTIEPCVKCLSDSGLNKASLDEIILVGGMTRCPIVDELIEKTFGKKPKRNVNPDEAVAIGAAIQAGILKGKNDKLLLLDVTPLSLGIETMGGIFTKLIDRNSKTPIKKSSLFSTAIDNQDKVIIKVYQGERPLASDNKYLGELNLINLTLAPRGVPKIEVSFEIDADGLLHVTATDRDTNQKQDITVQNSTGLSEDEINKMIEEAETNREKDLKHKEKIEHKYNAKILLNKALAFIASYENRLSNSDKNRLNDAKITVENALNNEDEDGSNIKSAMHVLSSLISELSAKYT